MSDLSTMTDPTQSSFGTSAGEDPLAQPQQPMSSAPSVDTSGIDDNLRYISSLEQTWGLPQLPDNVKLDIASQQGADTTSIGKFLFGLASDLNPLSTPQASASPLQGFSQSVQQFNQRNPLLIGAQPPGSPDLLSQLQLNPYDPNKLVQPSAGQSLMAGLQGDRAPLGDDVKAAQFYKLKAMSYGLLAPGTPDGSWNPADNTLVSQVVNQDFSRRLAGDHPGSIAYTGKNGLFTAMRGPLGIVNAVSTPTDILAGVKNAVVHSFVPRQKDLNTAHQSMWDWLHHPTDPGKFFHFLKTTVPVVVPIATDVLMVTGAGEVIGAARALGTGAEVSEGMRGLYTASEAVKSAQEATQGLSAGARFAQSLNPMSDLNLVRGAGALDRAGQAGFLASKLQGSDWAWQRAVGDKMAAWRALAPVAAAKTVASPVFRVGATQQIAAHLDPQSQQAADVAAQQAKIERSSLAGPINAVFTSALAPPTIFRPGTFKNMYEPAGAVFHRLTTVAQSTQQAYEVAKGMGYKSVADMIAQHGGQENGGAERAGSLVTWATHVAAIQHDAIAHANEIAKSEAINPDAWHQAYQGVVNSRIAQVQHIDPGDIDTFVHVLRQKAGDNVADTALSMLRHEDPAVAGQWRQAMDGIINDHNTTREVVMKQLVDNLMKNQGALQTHVSNYFENGENWGNFLMAHDQMRASLVGDGLLNAPAAVRIDPSTGQKVYKDLRYEPAFADVRTAGMRPGDPGVTLAKDVLQRAKDDPSFGTTGAAAPLARRLVASEGRFGLARVGEATKQDAIQFLATIRQAQQNIASIKYLERNPQLHQGLSDVYDVMNGTSTSASDMRDLIGSQFGGQLNESALGKLKNAGSFLQRSDKMGDLNMGALFRATPQDRAQMLKTARESIQGDLQKLADNPDAWGRFGNVGGNNLAERIDWLTKKSKYLAAEVDVPPEVKQQMSQYGYKVVHGAQFVHPHDVLDTVEPVASVSKLDTARMSLGAFVHPQNNVALAHLVNHKLHNELIDGLDRLGKLDPESALSGDSQANNIIHSLYSYIEKQRGQAEEGLKTASVLGPGKKFKANVFASRTPQGLRDLTFPEIREALKDVPEIQTGKDVAVIKRAISASHDIGFQYRGLASLEDKIRAYNPILDDLLLGKTSSGHFLRNAGIGAVAGAGFGTAQSAVQGNTSPDQLLGAAFGGALSGASMATMIGAAKKVVGFSVNRPSIATKLEDGNWLRYSFLPDDLAHLRNSVRFSISPYFDLRRYTKGAVLAQMAADRNNVQLPLNLGMKQLSKDFGPDAPQAAKIAWDSLTRGNHTAIEDTERFYTQRGVLGYSPQDQMAATHYRLLQQGKTPQESKQIVNKIFGYGQGRSALEQSVNFMFFPFSFEKKVAMAGGKFLTDDASRLLMLHDALKTYDVLNQHYHLSHELQAHVPVLQDIEKLNAFAHGLSPGQFGGLNAPFRFAGPLVRDLVESVPGANKFLPLFLPVGMQLHSAAAHKSAQNMLTRLIPAWNDIKRLTTDLASQGHVFFGASHLTPQAEVDAGYAHYNLVKQGAEQQAQALGYSSYAAAARSEPDLKNAVALAKAKIGNEFPEWAKALTKSQAKYDEQQFEMNRILAGPATPDRDMLASYKEQSDGILKDLTANGLGSQDVPSDIAEQMRMLALQLAQNSDAVGGQFRDYYKTYFQKLWGPIDREYA